MSGGRWPAIQQITRSETGYSTFYRSTPFSHFPIFRDIVFCAPYPLNLSIYRSIHFLHFTFCILHRVCSGNNAVAISLHCRYRRCCRKCPALSLCDSVVFHLFPSICARSFEADSISLRNVRTFRIEQRRSTNRLQSAFAKSENFCSSPIPMAHHLIHCRFPLTP